MDSFKYTMVGSLLIPLLLIFYPKYACKNCPYSTYEFPLLPCLLDSHSSQGSLYFIPCSPIFMGCDHSHPPSYMSLMIGLSYTQSTNKRLHAKIKNSGMWVGLIPMNNSPLDPSLLWNHSPPLFFISFISQPTIITFINYFNVHNMQIVPRPH